MRYPASEKLEIIRLVEKSHLPARRKKLGIPRATFHRWYDRFLSGGEGALEDRRPQPGRVWNRIPETVRDRIVELALDKQELSPRELAVTFTDTESYFVSEASVYRLLKANDLIASPAFIVIKAANDEGRRRHRHAEPGAHSIRLRSGDGAATATPAVRQWPVLHRWRTGRLATASRHASHPRRTVSSSNPGQD